MKSFNLYYLPPEEAVKLGCPCGMCEKLRANDDDAAKPAPHIGLLKSIFSRYREWRRNRMAWRDVR